MKLLIAIPAYNEESSIESVIARSLEARDNIIRNSPVTEVDVTVVSDGSTDRTVQLAGRYRSMINLIAFTENRGYGAAIKEAWRQSDADVLGFLDADGTCDPNFFAELCRTMETQQADVALGCRMTPASRMPALRRVGNTFFAALLRVLSSEPVRDAASGMRVVRRSVLEKLFPLPDGLHFTPAMSAQAVLGGAVRVAEVDMPYHERQGKSKLKVLHDGWRFLRVILEAALLFRPARPLGILGGLAGLAAAALMVYPAYYYLANRAVAEWMIYRFVVSHLAGTSAVLLFAASYLTSRMARLTVAAAAAWPWEERIRVLLKSSWFWTAPVVLMLAGGGLVLPSFFELVRTGATYEHWSRFIAMTFLYAVALILVVTRAIDYVLELIERRLAWLKSAHV
jgi:glycosyltransferase involved in cell wall biosynthesis